MRLVKLPVNQAWVFTLGGQLIDIDGKRLFDTRADAVWYAHCKGLGVTVTGEVFDLGERQ